MRTNVLVRELDLHPGQNRLDARRLEVVVDGLELFNGAQLAVDTTLVLGTPRRRDRLSEGSNSGWRSPQKSQSTEGENPSITRWRGRTRQIGGPCCRSGVDVGQTKLPSSCVLWRGPKRRVLRSPPKAKWHTHGIGDGGNFWHAQLRSRSRTRCWSTRRQPLPAAQHPQRLM